MTPYHFGPLLAETATLVPTLLRLHDFGVFTYESNPYELERVAEDVAVEYEQKPYLDCIVSSAQTRGWEEFFAFLTLHEELVVEGHMVTVEPPERLLGSANVDEIKHFRFRPVNGDWTPYKPYESLNEWRWDARDVPVLNWQSMLNVDPIVIRVIANRWGPFDLVAVVLEAAQYCLEDLSLRRLLKAIE